MAYNYSKAIVMRAEYERGIGLFIKVREKKRKVSGRVDVRGKVGVLQVQKIVVPNLIWIRGGEVSIVIEVYEWQTVLLRYLNMHIIKIILH